MASSSQHVTLVNRTSKTLKGVWNAIQYDLAPGKHSFSEVMAEKFKAQNPVMGTGDLDPYSLAANSLLGIEEYGDDCSPIEQSDSIERCHPSLHRRPVEVVPGDNGIYSVRDVAQAVGNLNSKFEK